MSKQPEIPEKVEGVEFKATPYKTSLMRFASRGGIPMLRIDFIMEDGDHDTALKLIQQNLLGQKCRVILAKTQPE